MEIRLCSRCEKPYPLTVEYYPMRNNGWSVKQSQQCIFCMKDVKKACYEKRKEHYKAKSKRQREQHREEIKEYLKKYHEEHKEELRLKNKERLRTPEGKAKRNECSKRYRSTPEGKMKEHARNRVNKALKAGKITNPHMCEMCGALEAEAHHDDYAKPLEVRWLCKQCHEFIHHLNEGQRS